MTTEASHATADAAAASTPMSGIGRLSLSFEAETTDVHWPLRTRIRCEARRSHRLARHAVRRVPIRRSPVADTVAAWLRARRRPSGRAVHDSDVRQLSVLAQPPRGMYLGRGICGGVRDDPPSADRS